MRRRRVPRRPAAPPLLDPILTAWDRLDRRRRHIHPARPGAILGVEFRCHVGPAVLLGDGVIVRRGDLLGELHIDNGRLRELVREVGWFGIARAWEDLGAIGRWTAGCAREARPVAYHATTLLAPIAVRAGFMVRPRARTARARLDDWFLRWLMAHWAGEGRGRLARGTGLLRSVDCWMSADALLARYAPRPGEMGERPDIRGGRAG